MKNKNYQTPSTINDTQIMAEMLGIILIPKLIQTRKIYMEDLPVLYSTPSEKNNYQLNASNNQNLKQQTILMRPIYPHFIVSGLGSSPGKCLSKWNS